MIRPVLFNSAFEAPIFERVLIGVNPENSLEYQFRGGTGLLTSPATIIFQHKCPEAGQTSFHLRERRPSLTMALLGFSIWGRVMVTLHDTVVG